MLKKIFLSLFLYTLIALIPDTIHAKSENQFITIVNPVRISKYTKNVSASLESQYSVITKYGLPATWLLTFDVLEDENATEVIKNFSDNQELGIFLEITPGFSSKAGIKYNDSGFWHHSDAVFLSGYTQEERKVYIDLVFESFKDKFGHYPNSIGAWWIDSFSLSYMQDKYGIIAYLNCADQFVTDGYQLWGQYWSTSYFPSLTHSAIPSQTQTDAEQIVVMQWASRDPLNGYYDSKYSIQDYFVLDQDLNINYFEDLLKIYTKALSQDSFGHMVVGLEGDLNSNDYPNGEFEEQIKTVKKYYDNKSVQVTTMSSFASWFNNSFDISPSRLITSNDLLGKQNKKVFWYQSHKYRLGMTYNYDNNDIEIFDFRTYHSDLIEPYYFSPNGNIKLQINTPSILNKIDNKENVWKLNFGQLTEVQQIDNGYTFNFADKRKITLLNDEVIFDAEDIDFHKQFENRPEISLRSSDNLHVIKINENWLKNSVQNNILGLTVESKYKLKSKKFILLVSILSLVLIFLIVKLIASKRYYMLLGILLLSTLGIFYVARENLQVYYVSQDEISALRVLRNMPQGAVVVYDRDCLACDWHTPNKPAVFSNVRKYVGQISEKKVIYNSRIFEAGSRENSLASFDNTDAKYIYLVEYEDYKEDIPFSPGDLGVEKVYSNANATIWRKK